MNVENTEANPLIAHIYEMVKELNDRNKKKKEKKDKNDKSDAQEVTTSSSSSGDTDSTRYLFKFLLVKLYKLLLIPKFRK